jgi:inosine/xanthosine triphosphate pyrophosphatase family protein
MLINTSNKNKQKEFRQFLGNQVLFLPIDLKEIKSQDFLLVSAYKAKDIGSDILIDDTSLFIDGEIVGTDIKWVLNNLNSFIGKKALFVCSLAIKCGSEILVFTGEVSGEIVSPIGNSFGFDNSFLPDDSIYTLGQQKDNLNNARYLAIQNFLNNVSTKVYSNLPDWTGDYQS